MKPNHRTLGESEPVAVSPAMKEVLSAALDVAPTLATVLLHGESGTGKEVISRFIHRHSQRQMGPYVAVNCAALPNDLLESELFGHERGAFTGATEKRLGKVELADQGTLLLDEVSELPLGLQAKLLRVIQERELDRIGGTKPIPVDVRIIATSNRDLSDMVSQGLFRADLYYRLNVFPIALPALRQRKEDLRLLVEALLENISRSMNRAPPTLSEEAWQLLQSYPFPGNVRELGNILERACIVCRTGILQPSQLALPKLTASWAEKKSLLSATTLPSLDLSVLERLAIEEALRKVNGNRTHAARLLGIGLRTLRNKLNDPRRQESCAESVAQSSQSHEAA